jgi:hypothetical protein
MKSIKLLLIFILITKTTLAQTPADAGSYLNQIGMQFTEISKDMMGYISAASHGKGAKKIDKRRQELIATLKEAEHTVRKMNAFEGDHQLRDSVVAYIRLSHLVLVEDYGKIVNMEEIAEQSYDAMEAYMLAKEKANEKLDVSYDKVKVQHDAFAKKHNIRIIENESKLSQKLETSGKVYSYYNKVYLVFFKSYKDEAYLMDALEKGDVNAIEQNKNALTTSTQEGIKKLTAIGTFNGDGSLKIECQKVLNFFQQEATKVSEQVDYFLKKENFEKIKKAFEAKRQNDRTQADVDKYNQAGKEFNASVARYNSTNNDLNKKRSESYSNWNNSVDSFLGKYVPRYR